jgi:hypothetical protein
MSSYQEGNQSNIPCDLSQQKISRDFKGIWIPKEIWLDDQLTYFEKFLLAEIHSLNGKDGCFASNEYFCNFFNERERKIQDGLAKLKAIGYIYVESFDGRIRILRTNLNIEKGKSLFSTSGVSNSAPLPPPNSTPLSYIYSKDDNKEQQQEVSAVVFSCLKDIKIPHKDKIEICKNYPENRVEKAVAYATHPETKITKGLVQAIKWACKDQPEIPKTKDELVVDNKAYAENLISKIKQLGHTRAEVCPQCVQITFQCEKPPVGIYFNENGFKDQLNNALRKHGFIIDNLKRD